ncbi:MAG: Ig-like domain-containing protein, partial [bacterium]
SKFIRGYYFKIKFKLAQKINSITSASNGISVEKIYIFFYKICLKLLSQIVLLCGGQKESFEILKEDLQDKYRKKINIIIDNQEINIEQITEKLKNNQLQNKDQVIQELIEKLFQLYKQKQKKTAVFSLAGLSIIIIASIVISLIMPAIRQSKAAADGVIDSVYKYAWSENIGWINFGAAGGNVHITDSGLTGYGWSENYGRINLNPSVSGVANDGEGNLSGSAWGENTGLIDFSGVTIDSDGDFNGYANGTITGRINFNCANSDVCDNLDYKVRTDWRPRSVRPACNNALDDDGDGLIDYPNDLGCESLTDDNEINPSRAIFHPPSPSNNPPSQQIQPSQPAQTDSEIISPDIGTTKLPVIIYPENNSVITTNKPTFHGTAEAKSNITLEILRGTTSLIKITTAANQWNEWYYYTATALTDGNYQIKIYAKNSGQNASETIVRNFSIQTSAENITPPEKTEPIINIPEIIKPAQPSTDETYQPKIEQNESNTPSELPPLTAQPFAGQIESPEEPTENNPNAGRSNTPETAETSASPTTNKPELFGNVETSPSAGGETVEPENMPAEVIVAKSSQGNFNLSANPENNSEQDKKTNPQIHGLAKQTINVFVKPAKPVLKILGQILLNGEALELNLKVNTKISSRQNFIGFLKPAPALAQNEAKKIPLVIQKFAYLDENNDDVYEAQIKLPDAANAYALKTLIYYKDETIKNLSAPVLVDPQGYIYEKRDGQETRINEATVSLYSLTAETKQYEIWDGSSYGQQNPQNTNQDGSYFFFAPEGKYYITVQAKGYNSYKSEIIDIEKSYPIINFNLELKKKTDWLKIIIFTAAGIISLLAFGWYIKKNKKQNDDDDGFNNVMEESL